MVAAIEATLVNNKVSKTFKFRAVAPIRNSKSQPAVPIPLVNTDPDNTLLFRFTGQSEVFGFTFALFDDGVDVSNGDSIVTINQQIAYLRDQIYTKEFDASWTLTHSRYYPSGVNCVIINMDVDGAKGSEALVIGSINLRRGRTASV